MKNVVISNLIVIQRFPPASVRMCVEKRCGMNGTSNNIIHMSPRFQFNQIICVSCALDKGHGGHVVKYDMRMEKVMCTINAVICSTSLQKFIFQIRDEIRQQVSSLSSRIDAKKERTLRKIDQLVNVAEALKPVQHHTS